MSARADKYHWYYRFVGTSDAAFGTSDHDLHRIRRGAQQGYFTQANVARFDPTLNKIVQKLVSRIREFRETGQPVNLSDAYRSLATDVVTEFSFHESYNRLSSPDFAASFQRQLRDFPQIGIWHRHFGLILDIFQAIPPWLVRMINPAGVDVVNMFNVDCPTPCSHRYFVD
jgi:cytochrome P450